MTDDAPEPDLELGPRALNIHGERFGQLVALHLIRKSPLGNRWLFSCDCGGLAERTAAKVRSAVKLGHVPQCAECLREQTRGRWIAINAHMHNRYTELFKRTGRLWSWTSEDRLVRDIAAELDEEGWRAPQEEVPLPLVGYSLLDAIAMAEKANRKTLTKEELRQREAKRLESARLRDQTEQLEREVLLADLRERGRARVASEIAHRALSSAGGSR